MADSTTYFIPLCFCCIIGVTIFGRGNTVLKSIRLQWISPRGSLQNVWHRREQQEENDEGPVRKVEMGKRCSSTRWASKTNWKKRKFVLIQLWNWWMRKNRWRKNGNNILSTVQLRKIHSNVNGAKQRLVVRNAWALLSLVTKRWKCFLFPDNNG